MDVSVIFVNYKTGEMTSNAIKSVIEKTKNIEYEIIAVDNNSQDNSIDNIEKEFNNVRIIRSPINGGFGFANNLAIKQASGKYILCLNTDTLLINNAIKIMFDFMEKAENNNVGVCGGYLTDAENKPTICGGKLPSLTEIIWKAGLKYIFKEQFKNYQAVLKSDDEGFLNDLGYITGADIFFRKSVLDEVGLFDEEFFMFYEEVDLCKRIKDKGYEIKFINEAKIQHLEGGSTTNQIKKLKILKTSEFIYFKKHSPYFVCLIKLIYLVLYLIDWLIFKNKKNGKELFLFILKGCKN